MARLLFAILLFAIGVRDAGLFGQIRPASLEARLHNAELVVEGEVTRSHSYWGPQGDIYTSHVVAIRKHVKGGAGMDSLEIILRGGSIGQVTDWLSHHLYLAPGDLGMFFLVPHPYMQPVLVKHAPHAFDVFADLQGCIRYQEQPGETVGIEPFAVYHDIARELYPRLGWLHGGAPILHRFIPEGAAGAPSVDSIRPLSITAGTRSELTLQGAGFGDTKGKVYFRNADDGGATRMAGDSTDILYWSDTLVRLWVPSVTPLPNVFQGTAGSGSVLLQTSTGDTAESQERLEVGFAVQNGRDQFIGVSRYAFLPDQATYFGSGSAGGFVFRLSNSFSLTDSAEAAFRLALRQWRCATGVNFNVGADTAFNTFQPDSINIVKWDDGPLDNLPANVLGRTDARLIQCADNLEQGHYVEDIDFVFSRNQAWNFDTLLVDTTKWDFLSVALHEIGHAHLLYHVIDPSEIMHFVLDSGRVNRMIAGTSAAAGDWVMDSSVIGHGACPPPMIRLNAADCNSLMVPPSATTFAHFYIFPNPSRGNCSLKYEGPGLLPSAKIEIMSLLGVAIDTSGCKITRIARDEWQVDLSGLQPGIYLLRLQDRTSSFTAKLIRIP